MQLEPEPVVCPNDADIERALPRIQDNMRLLRRILEWYPHPDPTRRPVWGDIVAQYKTAPKIWKLSISRVRSNTIVLLLADGDLHFEIYSYTIQTRIWWEIMAGTRGSTRLRRY